MTAIYKCDKCAEKVSSINAHTCRWKVPHKKDKVPETLCKLCNLIKIREERRMKCVKNSKGKISRVKEDIAYERVLSGDYAYCSKSEWKKASVQKKDDKGV